MHLPPAMKSASPTAQPANDPPDRPASGSRKICPRRPEPSPTCRQLLLTRSRLTVSLGTCFLVLAMVGPVRLAASPPDTSAASPLDIPAKTWAVESAKNEALVIQHPGSYLRYRLHIIDAKGDRLHDQIETPDGGANRLIQKDGRPLTPAEDAAERQRLKLMLDYPAAHAHHVQNEQNNKRMGLHMLNLVAAAMLWSYAPGQPQLPGRPSGSPALIVLDFKPNPAWSPPTMEAEPLTGLEGRIWIDPSSRRIVRLDGDLTHAVNIGWGILAHLYPGGTVTMQQTQVEGTRWIVKHVVEHLNLREFMVRDVKQSLVYDSADYQPVPAMTYQQAIKILLDTPLPTH